MACGTSKAIYPTVVMCIIIFWNLCLKDVRFLFMVRNVFRNLMCLIKLVIVRTCGPKCVNVIHLLLEVLFRFSLICCSSLEFSI